jgi:hypothetical protein
MNGKEWVQHHEESSCVMADSKFHALARDAGCAVPNLRYRDVPCYMQMDNLLNIVVQMHWDWHCAYRELPSEDEGRALDRYRSFSVNKKEAGGWDTKFSDNQYMAEATYNALLGFCGKSDREDSIGDETRR